MPLDEIQAQLTDYEQQILAIIEEDQGPLTEPGETTSRGAERRRVADLARGVAVGVGHDPVGVDRPVGVDLTVALVVDSPAAPSPTTASPDVAEPVVDTDADPHVVAERDGVGGADEQPHVDALSRRREGQSRRQALAEPVAQGDPDHVLEVHRLEVDDAADRVVGDHDLVLHRADQVAPGRGVRARGQGEEV